MENPLACILIIESDASERAWLESVLTTAEHQITGVASIPASIELGADLAPDCIVLDAKALRRRGGSTFIHIAKQWNPAVSFIVLCERDSSGRRAVALPAPLQGEIASLVPRPALAEELTLAVERSIEVKSLRRHVRALRKRLKKARRHGAKLSEHMPRIPGASLVDIERYAIIKTLEHTHGSTSRAARILGISARKIQYKLRDYAT